MNRTTFTEERSYRPAGGYVEISYHCSHCDHTVSFPEQQGFKYCYLCGAKVSRIKSQSLTWNPLA